MFSWITSFPVLEAMIDERPRMPQRFFSTRFFFARSRATEHLAPADEDGARVLDAEEVRKLPVVFAVVYDEVRALPRFERARLVPPVQTVGRVDGRRRDRKSVG